MKKTIIAISIIMNLNILAEENPDNSYTKIETEEAILDIHDTVSGGVISLFNMLKGNDNTSTQYIVDKDMEKKLEKFKSMLNEKIRSNELKQTFHFKTAAFNLLEDQKNYLNNIVLSLDNYESLQYEISGYSDIRGNSNYNAELSRNRINSVLTILNNLGVSNDNISINNLGETLSKDAKEYEDFFFDRKVELIISK